MSVALRTLPLAAKLVIAVFLLSVGLGFCSAMVQLHFKETPLDGTVLPGPDNVQQKYCGYREFDGKFPTSKLESIIAGDPNGAFNKANMAPAFFSKSTGYEKDKTKSGAAKVDAAREGERQAVLAWIKLDAEARKKAYDDDDFVLPEALKATSITDDFAEGGKAKIKSILDERCARCHDGQQQKPALNEWSGIEPLLEVPVPQVFDFAGKQWVKNDKQTSMDGLAQSTHAHLFGFSVLYALTGLILAFSSYPSWVKAFLCPLALAGQVLDIGCWWLARLEPPYGPAFAVLTLATGGIAALALACHIFLSLFDLFATKGKVVLVLLIAAVLGGGGSILWTKGIQPGLDAEKARSGQKASP